MTVSAAASARSLEQIARRVLSLSRSGETEVTVASVRGGLTRFAGNRIHQHVDEDSFDVSVRVRVGARQGRAGSTRCGADALSEIVDRAAEVARQMPEEADLPPLPAPADNREKTGDRHASTESATPAQRAKLVGAAIAEAASKDLSAAGYLSTYLHEQVIANSRGLLVRHARTEASFSATCQSPDSSGWVREVSCDLSRLDVAALARRAATRAVEGAGPTELAPGAYTVVLEPAAVDDLLWFLATGFNGRAIEEKQSFLTGRLGQKLFGENVDLSDDVHHPLQSGEPFDGEGAPRGRLVLIEKGVARDVAVDARTARSLGRPPTGHALPEPNSFGAMARNLVLSGGAASPADLVAGTRRGILVTRFWYIRLVEPMTVTVTGMTRDGTFWIEDGKVVRPIRNLRFNQSLVAMLGNVEALGAPERAGGIEHALGCAVVPPMRVRDFRFTSVAPS